MKLVRNVPGGTLLAHRSNSQWSFWCKQFPKINLDIYANSVQDSLIPASRKAEKEAPMNLKLNLNIVAVGLVVLWLLGLRLHLGGYAYLFLITAMVIVIFKKVAGRPGEL
jgi:hypothetical protein